MFRAIVAVIAIVPCLLALQALTGHAASAATGPTITSVSPDSGPTTGGTLVTITGSGFTGATAVTFSSASATNITVASDTEITAVTPAGTAGTAAVRVVTPIAQTAALYTYTAATGPTITSVSPDSGPATGGTLVTITGTGFTGATEVLFRSTPATNITVASDTEITAVTPAGTAGLAAVRVVTPIAQTAALYTYVAAPPTITSLSPDSGPTTGGTLVTITGTGFTGATEVLFRSTPATNITVTSDTEITAVAPAGTAGLAAVRVVTPIAQSTALYTYVAAPPTITSLSPDSGPTTGGTLVTITGTGFTGATAVMFGSTPATSFTVDTPTTIAATAPGGSAGTVDVTVTGPAGTSSTSAADQYTYRPVVHPCTTTITGTHAKRLTVTSGQTCLVHATQKGQVTVAAGAALSVTNSTINGTVTATSPSGISYCGVTEHGPLTVTGATGPVTLGRVSNGSACAADTIPSAVTITGATAPVTVSNLTQTGTLTLKNDTDEVTFVGSKLKGPAYVEDNAATASAQITVSGNTVTGPLYCTGNNPAPTDNGIINIVSGTASGQCAAIAEHYPAGKQSLFFQVCKLILLGRLLSW